MTRKVFEHPSGIYQIRNLINQKRYIGQSCRLVDRRYTHFRLLKLNKEHTPHLQNAWNKYGEDNFVFEVLMYCDVDKLDFYEQVFIDKLHPEYNVRKEATSNRGHKTSEETKMKISKANTGRVYTEEQKKRMGDAHKGLKRSDEYKEKQSKRMMGHKMNVGKIKSPETLSKLSASLKESWKHRARTFSDDVKKKFSISHINSPHTKRGEENNKAKLDASKVSEIRRLHRNGFTAYALGKMFGVSDVAIGNVCKYKTWKHIP